MDDDTPGHERELELRRKAFARAGFAQADADALARRPEIAYLDALAIVRQGFPPEVAASMLLAGSRSVY
ncbi:MAG: hypothetical protein ACKVUT_07060 [Gaiella sp.]